MGTMIQTYGLGEKEYRGERFRTWPRDLKGHNDLLIADPAGDHPRDPRGLPRSGRGHPRDQHFQLDRDLAGRLRDGGLVYELNHAAARLARDVADEFEARTPDAPRFVAGVLGPTNRTASISPDVNDPGFRERHASTSSSAAYAEAARGLVDGGADLLLVETIFDTLNAKAALFAIDGLFEAARRPRAGHDLGHHHRRERTHALGPDHRGVLELGGARAARSAWGSTARWAPGSCASTSQELSRVAPTCTSARIRTPGLPNEFGGYDETPGVRWPAVLARVRRAAVW